MYKNSVEIFSDKLEVLRVVYLFSFEGVLLE